jgi:hypothetical protein
MPNRTRAAKDGRPVPRSRAQRHEVASSPATTGCGKAHPPAASAGRAPAAEAPEPDSSLMWDRLFRARVGRLSLGLSPPGLLLVYLDWLAHLAFSPGKQQDLVRKWFRKALRFGLYAARDSLRPGSRPAIEPLPQDQRFDDPAWQRWPFNLYYQSFLLTQQWWHNATTGIRGVSRHDEQAVTFITRQLLDVVSPSNFPCSNPQVLKPALEQGAPTSFAARRITSATWSGRRSEESRPGRRISRWARRSPSRRARSFTETGSLSYCSTSRPRKPSTPSRS